MKYIIAIGNMTRGDDGIGAHIIEYILNQNLENNFQALDFSTNVWGILPLLTIQTKKILIIDCAYMQEQPGSSEIFPLDYINKRNQTSLETHESSLQQLLEVARKADYPIPNISIMGIEPDKIDYDLSLSKKLEDKLIDYVQQAIKFIQTD